MSPREPKFQPLEKAAEFAHWRSRVPADLQHLEGHFPGSPIVPAFMQVDWALSQVRACWGIDHGVSHFEGLRFTRPLLPGCAFELRVRQQERLVHFELLGDEGLFSSGRFRFDAKLQPHSVQVSDGASLQEVASLCLPHQGTMRLLDAVVGQDLTSTTTTARLREGGAGTASNGEISSCLVIELLAQAMAAHGGKGQDTTSAPRRGFLVSARQVTLKTSQLFPEERLWLRADHLRGTQDLVAFRCSLGHGSIPQSEKDARDRALAWGTLGAWIESEFSQGVL